MTSRNVYYQTLAWISHRYTYILECRGSRLVSPFDHFHFALIHGPDIPGSYEKLLFTALDLVSITSHIHNWILVLLWFHPFILSGVFLHGSPVAYWALSNLGNSSFSILSFCLFILFMGFSRQEYWNRLPFPFPVDHILFWPLHHDPPVLGGPTRHGLLSLS